MSAPRPETEAPHPRSASLDAMTTMEVLRLMNEEDAGVAAAVAAALPRIAAAVDAIVERLRRGGRLVYAGAGTSGRLARLDAVECVPTFGVPPTLVLALVAGGDEALVRSVEGAEDDTDAARQDVVAIDLAAPDALVGIAASGATPYVAATLSEARARGALTIAISNSEPAPILDLADHPIPLRTGPEILAGSTRLKAGTAQKLVLNMLSTAVMVRLGKVYGNRMIDLRATNRKLRERATGIVSDLVGCPPDEARRLLAASDGEVKTAVLMGLTGLNRDAADAALRRADGVLRDALRQTDPDDV